MRKILAAVAALLLSGSFAYAGNVSLLSGPQDPSQLNAVVNTLIISGNQSWSPGGNSVLNQAGVISTGTTTITISGAVGANGISPSTPIAWLKVTSFVTSNTTTPMTYFLPMWGCLAAKGNTNSC
jgi:hypothetical protein